MGNVLCWLVQGVLIKDTINGHFGECFVVKLVISIIFILLAYIYLTHTHPCLDFDHRNLLLPFQ